MSTPLLKTQPTETNATTPGTPTSSGTGTGTATVATAVKGQQVLQKQQQQPSAVRGFIAGGMAACGAVTLTNPAEVIKTRLQLQGELVKQSPNIPKIYTSFPQALTHILRYEGIRGIQRGLGSAYMYQLLMNGTRLGLYEPIKFQIHRLVDYTSGSVGVSATGQRNNNNLVNIIAGGTGGVLSAFLASPLFLVKTRLQSYTSHAASVVGHQHHYRHTFQALSRIYGEEGIRGLYRGVDASMLRTGVGSAVQLPLYDIVKQKLITTAGMENGALCHATSSLISGFFLCIVMNPFDIVSTRMFNQAGEFYKNPLDCFVKTIRTEGIGALYKGFTAHYLRIGPHTIFT
ncbi:Mitochondrial oxaloacetate carrier protein [Gryganskiella cystojenkinii]|nr:Mitochondrial oxaloacetate carrier protein [Gryganskiella cystojenkinii]